MEPETLSTQEAFRPNSGHFGSMLGPVAVVVGRLDLPLEKDPEPVKETNPCQSIPLEATR